LRQQRLQLFTTHVRQFFLLLLLVQQHTLQLKEYRTTLSKCWCNALKSLDLFAYLWVN
jgi:hypothetical protein